MANGRLRAPSDRGRRTNLTEITHVKLVAGVEYAWVLRLPLADRETAASGLGMTMRSRSATPIEIDAGMPTPHYSKPGPVYAGRHDEAAAEAK
jgi:hypothetical protein